MTLSSTGSSTGILRWVGGSSYRVANPVSQHSLSHTFELVIISSLVYYFFAFDDGPRSFRGKAIHAIITSSLLLSWELSAFCTIITALITCLLFQFVLRPRT